MKRLSMILVTIALVVIAACSCNSSFAQVSATAQATVTIVTPLTIEKMNDLEFEQFTERKATTPAARRIADSRTANAVAAATTSTTMKPAAFNVTGYPGYTYGVNVPATVTVSDGSRAFTLDNIVASGSFNQILSANGKGTVSISGKPSFRTAEVFTAYSRIETATDDEEEEEEEEPQGLPITIIYN